MKAYALVQGPRRKVLCVSDSCEVLWETGACMFEYSAVRVRTDRNNRAICKENGAYIVRITFELGAPITAPRERAVKERGDD